MAGPVNSIGKAGHDGETKVETKTHDAVK